MLSVADVLVAALMAMLGVMELLDFAFDGLSNLSEAFLAAYMVLFAALLAGYEFIWWQPISSFNKVFRKNFGFMYGLKGKGFYLIFIAFLCLGLWDGSPRIKGLDYITGVSWLAVGCLHLFLSCCYPNANDAYHPATAGLVQAGATNTQGTPNDNVV